MTSRQVALKVKPVKGKIVALRYSTKEAGLPAALTRGTGTSPLCPPHARPRIVAGIFDDHTEGPSR